MKVVMVVDDSPTVRKILQVALGRVGYQVILCTNGVEALRYCTQPQAVLPDLIFLDVRMPALDGFEVAQRLRKNHRLTNTAIVLLTRCDSTMDKIKARLAGAQAVMSKPFRQVDIVARVHYYIGSAEPQTSPYTSSLVSVGG